MSAITDYASLAAEIQSWSTRTYTDAQLAGFIQLATTALSRRLGPNYRRRVTSTINTDATGLGTLPSDFEGGLTITRDAVGSLPLRMVNWDAMVERNPYGVGFDADVYAVRGTSIMVSGSTDDTFSVSYLGSLAAIDATTTTTNWLLTLAPDAYLAQCRAVQSAFEEDFAQAQAFGAQAQAIMDEVLSIDFVAEFGNAQITSYMDTP